MNSSRNSTRSICSDNDKQSSYRCNQQPQTTAQKRPSGVLNYRLGRAASDQYSVIYSAADNQWPRPRAVGQLPSGCLSRTGRRYLGTSSLAAGDSDGSDDKIWRFDFYRATHTQSKFRHRLVILRKRAKWMNRAANTHFWTLWTLAYTSFLT